MIYKIIELYLEYSVKLNHSILLVAIQISLMHLFAYLPIKSDKNLDYFEKS